MADIFFLATTHFTHSTFVEDDEKKITFEVFSVFPLLPAISGFETKHYVEKRDLTVRRKCGNAHHAICACVRAYSYTGWSCDH